MSLKGVKVGLAITGSFCTLLDIFPIIRLLVEKGAEVYPVISDSVNRTDTKHGRAEDWKYRIKQITGRDAITNIADAEPFGPQKLVNVMVIAPCTGNTLAKLAMGVTDTPVLMAVKAHLRNLRPTVLTIATNDGLGMNAKNIGMLLNTKNIYMVPFGQDNHIEKPNSLVSKLDLIPETIEMALRGKQAQPVLISF